jgi:hypothetical protein
MTRVLPWAITLLLLAAAWLVAFVTPTDRATTEPFPITATIGEEVIARDFVLTVQQVRAAESISTTDGWSAEGTWMLVDLTAEAARVQNGTRLSGATLTIDDRTYRASERMTSMFGHPLVPGIPYRGALAFELPQDALDGTGVLHLSTRDDDRGDNVAELTVDLGALELLPAARLDDIVWGQP